MIHCYRKREEKSKKFAEMPKYEILKKYEPMSDYQFVFLSILFFIKIFIYLSFNLKRIHLWLYYYYGKNSTFSDCILRFSLKLTLASFSAQFFVK